MSRIPTRLLGAVFAPIGAILALLLGGRRRKPFDKQHRARRASGRAASYFRALSCILVLVMGIWMANAPQARADYTYPRQSGASLASAGPSSAHPAGDGFWSDLIDAVVKIVVTVAEKAVAVIKTVRVEEVNGAATVLVDLKPVFDDINTTAATSGFAGPPFGFARGLVSATGSIPFINMSETETARVTATVSRESSFSLVARSPSLLPNPPPGTLPTDLGSASVGFTFGEQGMPPLYNFSRQIDNGSLSGELPEANFEFVIPPKGSLVLDATVTASGEATAVPEPSTLVMIGVGALCLLGYAGLRHKWAA